jgi:hypothetical protein
MPARREIPLYALRSAIFLVGIAGCICPETRRDAPASRGTKYLPTHPWPLTHISKTARAPFQYQCIPRKPIQILIPLEIVPVRFPPSCTGSSSSLDLFRSWPRTTSSPNTRSTSKHHSSSASSDLVIILRRVVIIILLWVLLGSGSRTFTHLASRGEHAALHSGYVLLSAYRTPVLIPVIIVLLLQLHSECKGLFSSVG